MSMHRTRRLAAFVGALLVVGMTAMSMSPANATSSAVERAVEVFRGHAPFQGIANDQLAERDGELQLGVVTVDTGIEGVATGHDGYVELGTTDDGTTIVAASDGAGMDQFGLIIKDRSAERHRFPVTLPADAEVVHEPTGAIEVRTSHGTTTLAPAVAVDASGATVPARYRIQGGELVIDVELAGAQLPVMVDPVSANRWWGHEDWYSINDVRWQANWWNVGGIVKAACRGNSACIAIAGAYTNWVYNTWQQAKNTGQCIHMKQLWTGQIIGIEAYGCNWY
ncbi:MAG: hypothetical protein JWN67_1131 [Actinomycetia bacterium]|nr:hypothetical protein [Actinomycetes bacterium]